MNIRIIPRLDIKGPNLVKGIHLEGLRVLGKPWDFAHKYYQDGADELIYIDAVASLYGRNNLQDIVRKTAGKIFIPLTVGGGIRSLEDIRELLRVGADKVAINTAAIQKPELIKASAEVFGSQCIVASIQAKKVDGQYFAFTDNGRENSGVEVYEWTEKLVELGAGEILVTSVDREGTGKGYDIELIKNIAEKAPVPIIPLGGGGNPQHLVDVVKVGQADAICAASIFHYHYLDSEIDYNHYTVEGNIEFITKQRGNSVYMKDRIKPTGIKDIKRLLQASGVECRYEEAI